MCREKIPGYKRDYTLEELKAIPQYKESFGVPENEEVFYFQNIDPKEIDEGERFIPLKYDEYSLEVSNYGRIRYEGKILKQVDDENKKMVGFGLIVRNIKSFIIRTRRMYINLLQMHG